MSTTKRSTFMVVVATALSAAVSAADRIVPPAVPGNIEAPADLKPILWGHAVGTQNYICGPAATPSGVDWLFMGPQATVFDQEGRQIATHFLSMNPFQENALQPTWQHSGDTSAVWAKKLEGSLDANYVQPGAVEWLKLEVTGAQVGPAGGAKLSRATLIQRVNTAGGVKPPASECTPGTVNSRKFVPYEADYYFYQ